MNPFKPSYFLYLGLTLTCIFIFSGCKPTGVFSSVAGDYEGVLTSKLGGKSSQSVVSGNVTTSTESAELVLKVNQWTFTADFSSMTSGKLSAVGLPLLAQPIELTSYTDECFTSPDQALPAHDVKICFDGNQLTLYVGVPKTGDSILLIMNKKSADTSSNSNVDQSAVSETPRNYTLDELRDLAVKQSFNSLIEFQKMIQARLTMENTYAGLTPNVNVNAIFLFYPAFALTNLSIVSRLIGNFVPFLIPDRWPKAYSVALQSKAENYTWITTRADAANIAEGLALSLIRDKATLEILDRNLTEIYRVRDLVIMQENQSLVKAGTSNNILSVAQTMEETKISLQNVIAEEKYSIAQAAGFKNPLSVADVDSTVGFSIENPETFDPSVLRALALLNSTEILSMDELILAAQADKQARTLTWLDPSGDPAGNIGLGLPSYIEIGQSYIDQNKAQRAQVESAVRTKIANALSEATSSISSYRLIKNTVVTNTAREQDFELDMQNRVPVDMGLLVGVLQDKAKSEMDLVSAEFAYYTAVSKINRYTFQGPYAPLSPAALKLQKDTGLQTASKIQ